jgi:hypothetical protein
VGQRLNQDNLSFGSDAAKAVERMRGRRCQAFMGRRTVAGQNLVCVLIMFLTPARRRGINRFEQSANNRTRR